MTNPEMTAGVMPSIEAANAPEQAGRSHKLRAALAGVVILATGGSVYACSGDSDKAGREAAANANTIEMCANSTFSEVSTNAEHYATEAFLPKGEIKDAKSADAYVNTLFDKDGPLAGEQDQVSLGAFMATIVNPAHDGAAVNPNYDYLGTFKSNVAAYRAPGGDAKAKEDCKTAFQTAKQTVQYNGDWAQAGETVTQFTAVRNEANKITGMKLDQVVTNDKLAGAAMALRATAKGLDGFTEVLITPDGKMYVKGVTAGNGGSVSLEGENPEQVNPDAQTSIAPTPEDQAPAGGANAAEANSQDSKDGQAQTNDNKGTNKSQASAGAGGGSTGGASNGAASGSGSSNGNGPSGSAGTCGTAGSGCVGTTPGGSGAGGGSGGGSNGNGGGNGGGSGTTAPKPTNPPVTQAPTTRPPQTTIPATTRPPQTTIPPIKPPIECDPAIDAC